MGTIPWFLWSRTTFLNEIKILQENAGEPSYGIPEHAKPLLRKPTPVLEIKNVVQNPLFSFYEVIIFSFNFSGVFSIPIFLNGVDLIFKMLVVLKFKLHYVMFLFGHRSRRSMLEGREGGAQQGVYTREQLLLLPKFLQNWWLVS